MTSYLAQGGVIVQDYRYARVFHIDSRDLNTEYIDDVPINTINGLIRGSEIHHLLRLGDVVHFCRYSAYRNDGKVIWNGNSAVYLDTDSDEYGALPSTFVMNDNLPLNYWHNAIAHNNYIWLMEAGNPVRVDDTLVTYPAAYQHGPPADETLVETWTYGRYTIIVSPESRFNPRNHPIRVETDNDDMDGVPDNGRLYVYVR